VPIHRTVLAQNGEEAALSAADIIEIHRKSGAAGTGRTARRHPLRRKILPLSSLRSTPRRGFSPYSSSTGAAVLPTSGWQCLMASSSSMWKEEAR